MLQNLAQSNTFKILVLAFLILLLQIPLNMVERVIRDREYNQTQAESNIGDTWGRSQTLVGPFISIPYRTVKIINNKTTYKEGTLYLMPEQLDVQTDLTSEVKKRGIFEVPVYDAKAAFKGTFLLKNKDLEIQDLDKLFWDRAQMHISINDLRVISEVEFLVNNKKLEAKAGGKMGTLNQLSASLGFGDTLLLDEQKFVVNLHFRGSSSIYFAPLGKVSTMSAKANWPDPNFTGAFLPIEKTISENEFNAQWKVLEINRSFPNVFENNFSGMESAQFGVILQQPASQYQQSLRIAKYGILILSLTFLVFFFFQLLNNKKLHPIQYLFIGLAISIFYLLLVSFSEQIGMNAAYWISCLAVLTLIGGYTKASLKDTKLTSILLGILLVVYSFVFIIIRLEELALLAGSIGLFIILAVVMYMARNIDWYKNQEKN